MAPPTSWVPGAEPPSGFSLANLPFGVVSHARDGEPHVAVAVGGMVLDMKRLATFPGFDDVFSCLAGRLGVFSDGSLNAFAALGREVHREVRTALRDVLSEKTTRPEFLRDRGPSGTGAGASSAVTDDPDVLWTYKALVPAEEVTMHLPMVIGDYTDFYAGYHHAHHVGAMFRGPQNALQPNYLHLPVGYHGRASTVVVSGTDVRRPVGQVLDAAAEPKRPTTGPSRELDFELELGCLIGRPGKTGDGVPAGEAEDLIFGYVLLNDWSARDVQRWEYVPLGPFNGKNFATTVSGWVVLADALEGARVPALEVQGRPELQDYLREGREDAVFDIRLEVELTTNDGTSATIATVSSSNLLWSFPQMIAHHTLGGCALRTGDLLGSGTISGPEEGQRGSLLEMSEGGKKAFEVGGEGSGVKRTFLEDGDTVRMRGWWEGPDGRVGLGECVGRIVGRR